jgi:hypothetical protein
MMSRAAAENAIARQRGFCHKFILKKNSNLQKGKGVELLCLKFLLGQSNSAAHEQSYGLLSSLHYLFSLF